MQEKRNEVSTALFLLSQKKDVQLLHLEIQIALVAALIKTLEDRLQRYKAGALEELAFLQEQFMNRDQLNNLIGITDTLLDDQKKRDNRYERKRFAE